MTKQKHTENTEMAKLRKINRRLLAALKDTERYLQGIRTEEKFEESDLLSKIDTAIAKAEEE